MQIDCDVADVDAAAQFRAAATGDPVDPGHPGSRDRYRQLATPPDQPMIQVQRVEHESRVHLDIETDGIKVEMERRHQLDATVSGRWSAGW